MIGDLAGCVEAKKQYEACAKSVSWKPPTWVVFTLGVLVGGASVATAVALK